MDSSLVFIDITRDQFLQQQLSRVICALSFLFFFPDILYIIVFIRIFHIVEVKLTFQLIIELYTAK